HAGVVRGSAGRVENTDTRALRLPRARPRSHTQGGNSDMRQLAMVVAAFLVLAVISPAFAQPFADTPTNHWAYDAIAELGAKGLSGGCPAGPLRGDGQMTR